MYTLANLLTYSVIAVQYRSDGHTVTSSSLCRVAQVLPVVILRIMLCQDIDNAFLSSPLKLLICTHVQRK